MNEETKRGAQVLIGAIVSWMVLMMFLRTTGLVSTAMSPELEDGSLGSPVSVAAVVIIEFLISTLVSIGAAVMGFGFYLYNRFRPGKAEVVTPVAPVEARKQEAPAKTSLDLIRQLEKPKGLHPSERKQWEQALFMSFNDRDYRATIKASEKLAGEKYFPRSESETAKPEGEE